MLAATMKLRIALLVVASLGALVGCFKDETPQLGQVPTGDKAAGAKMEGINTPSTGGGGQAGTAGGK